MKIKHIIVLLLLLFTCQIWGQERGNASFYSSKLKGRKMANGIRYHPDSLTCAHRTYPFGTYLLVRNPKNNKQVIVKVTDRGPFAKNRIIDLSYSAAKTLDIIRQGVAPVEMRKINPMTYLFEKQITDTIQ